MDVLYPCGCLRLVAECSRVHGMPRCYRLTMGRWDKWTAEMCGRGVLQMQASSLARRCGALPYSAPAQSFNDSSRRSTYH